MNSKSSKSFLWLALLFTLAGVVLLLIPLNPNTSIFNLKAHSVTLVLMFVLSIICLAIFIVRSNRVLFRVLALVCLIGITVCTTLITTVLIIVNVALDSAETQIPQIDSNEFDPTYLDLLEMELVIRARAYVDSKILVFEKANEVVDVVEAILDFEANTGLKSKLLQDVLKELDDPFFDKYLDESGSIFVIGNQIKIQNKE